MSIHKEIRVLASLTTFYSASNDEQVFMTTHPTASAQPLYPLLKANPASVPHPVIMKPALSPVGTIDIKSASLFFTTRSQGSQSNHHSILLTAPATSYRFEILTDPHQSLSSDPVNIPITDEPEEKSPVFVEENGRRKKRFKPCQFLSNSKALDVSSVQYRATIRLEKLES